MQIETTECHLPPVSMTAIKRTDHVHVWQDVETRRPSCPAAAVESNVEIPQSHDPEIALLGIYQKDRHQDFKEIIYMPFSWQYHSQ